ncbi:MAG: TonB-dependent receptor plug domain-containing protein, partial [Gemmatimonadaceae bacterium]|nr:TonB-dependent receptor plug domain-containing protein [Gemmatimonadaceae bacterium]
MRSTPCRVRRSIIVRASNKAYWIVIAFLLIGLASVYSGAGAQGTPPDSSAERTKRDSVATLAPIVVATGRVRRKLEDEPERLEILSGEDVNEKSVMRPSDPTRLLSEMPGVRVQVVSPALGGAGVRLRGLRGRYTLVLSDGLPLYGQTEGIGFLDIPPLDLAQAEVIKGAASALYGPGALGGVLNLISRRPPRTGSLSDGIVNATSAGGKDLIVWHGRQVNSRSGVTAIGGVHSQSIRDVDRDGWADVPKFKRGEARVRAYRTENSGSNATATVGVSAEQRTG